MDDSVNGGQSDPIKALRSAMDSARQAAGNPTPAEIEAMSIDLRLPKKLADSTVAYWDTHPEAVPTWEKLQAYVTCLEAERSEDWNALHDAANGNRARNRIRRPLAQDPGGTQDGEEPGGVDGGSPVVAPAKLSRPGLIAVSIFVVLLIGAVVILLWRWSVTGEDERTAGGTPIAAAEPSCGPDSVEGECLSQARERVDHISQSASSENEFIEQIRRQSTTDPSGTGPWPFVVVDTQQEGLYARSTNEVIADRLGYAADRSLVFADCIATSSFTPPNIRRNAGPQWLRVKWKNTTQSTSSSPSDPSDPHTAWMYRGYLEPFGHNGKIPACP